MEQAVSQIVSPSDTPEQKLEKIYARCQTIRNTTFEQEKSQQEENREKLKEDRKRRKRLETWLWRWLGHFLALLYALVRAAGLDASPVLCFHTE